MGEKIQVDPKSRSNEQFIDGHELQRRFPSQKNSSRSEDEFQAKKIQVDPKSRSSEQFIDGHEFQRRFPNQKNSSRSEDEFQAKKIQVNPKMSSKPKKFKSIRRAGRTNSSQTATSFKEDFQQDNNSLFIQISLEFSQKLLLNTVSPAAFGDGLAEFYCRGWPQKNYVRIFQASRRVATISPASNAKKLCIYFKLFNVVGNNNFPSFRFGYPDRIDLVVIELTQLSLFSSLFLDKTASRKTLIS